MQITCPGITSRQIIFVDQILKIYWEKRLWQIVSVQFSWLKSFYVSLLMFKLLKILLYLLSHNLWLLNQLLKCCSITFELLLVSLAKWFSVCLRTKWLWALILLLSLKLQILQVSSKELLDILLSIECRFTLKRIHDMNQKHHTDKCSKHSSIIWPVQLNGWVFVYELIPLLSSFLGLHSF